MKKTLVTCVAVVALFAIASGAFAITCTTDQRPAATLLIPYFQATFNPETLAADTSSAASLDTLVTIGNASSAPMIAHVNVFNERSELVLDFNVALTGFDIQSWSMASLLSGNLPSTPVSISHALPAHEVCQRLFVTEGKNPPVFPAAGGFIRAIPGVPATGQDNTQATTIYPPGPFATAFLQGVLDSLDVTFDTRDSCGGSGVDGVITNPIHGYLTIDHANYCNLSNPHFAAYFQNDAAGMENNLWGDYIFTSGAGVGTMGFPAVAIEADPSLADEGPASAQSHRTFYKRYAGGGDLAGCNPGNVAAFGPNTFDCGAGDQREPLGLKYAARWFDTAFVTSFFNVWRASAGSLLDLIGTPTGDCSDVEPLVTLNFYDEDENTTTSGGCPSPCQRTEFNFPLETQRTRITGFVHPAQPAGWVSMSFFNGNVTTPFGGVLDQAYVTYDFGGASAFLSAGIPAAQLDPSACNPIGVVGPPITLPVIPTLVGTGP
jgi:hypothetical protein